MSYVDGYVIAVPTANKEKYKAFAESTLSLFRDHGATRLVECWGDEVPQGDLTSFPMAVKKKDDETVMFSWIWWESKEARDKGWAGIMADPRLPPQGGEPFDSKRMLIGGFEVLVDA